MIVAHARDSVQQGGRRLTWANESNRPLTSIYAGGKPLLGCPHRFVLLERYNFRRRRRHNVRRQALFVLDAIAINQHSNRQNHVCAIEEEEVRVVGRSSQCVLSKEASVWPSAKSNRRCFSGTGGFAIDKNADFRISLHLIWRVGHFWVTPVFGAFVPYFAAAVEPAHLRSTGIVERSANTF